MKALLKANVYHKRFHPTVNEFNYSGYYIKFTLNEMAELNSRIFSVNSFNLFSFYEKDHGYRDGSSLEVWARDMLKKSNIENFTGKIILQTFPRVLGYVFNPVSFWYCYENEQLRAIICEVNNTFGESHNYVLKNDPSKNLAHLSKCFHVSPFYAVEGKYSFDFTNLNQVGINYFHDEELQLKTSMKGLEIPFTDLSLLKLFFRYPFYTVSIVLLIHLQALKLFIKKNKFYSKPEKVKYEVTYE